VSVVLELEDVLGGRWRHFGLSHVPKALLPADKFDKLPGAIWGFPGLLVDAR
jgi:hypothetical protein